MSIDISVVMANWNDAKNLPSSIESIRHATWRNGAKETFWTDKQIRIEIIIVDDASEDNSVEVIKDTMKRYSDMDIRAFETHESLTNNGGLPFNIGIKRAKYPLILLNPSDTVHLSSYNLLHLAEDVLKFDKVFVCSHLFYWPPKTSKSIYRDSPADEGSMVKKEYLVQLHGWDERLKGSCAWGCDMYNRLKRLVKVMWCTKLCPVLHMDANEPLGLGERMPVRMLEDLEATKNTRVSRSRGDWMHMPEWGEHPLLEEIKP